MGLTLDTERRLAQVGLIDFFEKNLAVWLELARQSYAFVRQNFPPDAPIRPDDVSKVLTPLLETSGELTDFLAQQQLKQRYWVTGFAELIVDRCWAEIVGEGG